MSKRHDITIDKKTIVCVIGVLLTGIILLIHDYRANILEYDGTVTRNQTGEGTFSEHLQVQCQDYKTGIELEVNEVKSKSSNGEKLIEDAISEIESSYLGENENPEYIRKDIVVRQNYVSGRVKAEWSFDNYQYIDPSGKVDNSGLEKDGRLINAKVELSTEDIEKVYEFAFRIMPPEEGSYEYFLVGVQQELEDLQQLTREEERFVLPAEFEGKPLTWTRKMDYRGLELMILGLMAAVLVTLGKLEDKRRLDTEIRRQKENDYPMLVNQLAVLMGSGMGFKMAAQRICRQYQIRRDETKNVRPGFEELLIAVHEMEDGVGEMRAIENFGRRNGLKEYSKLSLLLSQNLRKGTEELLLLLEKENQMACEMRKQQALRRGEEASTKLLIPMGGMMLLVMVILIYPAIAVIGL